MSPVLKDKVAVITGGGRGIGRNLALKFAAEGARLLIPDLDIESAESVAGEIEARGGEAVAIKTDISDEKSTVQMAEKAKEAFGKADILINNAAIWAGLNITPWDAWSVEKWDQIFDVNVKGTWLCCKAIAPLMVKQSGGKIINIASGICKVPANQLFLPYSCSKGAVYTLTQSLARALGSSNINVNAIAPGLTASEATLGQDGVDKTFELAVAGQVLNRREKVEDLEGTAVFLASEASNFITGQIIFVDGGSVMC